MLNALNELHGLNPCSLVWFMAFCVIIVRGERMIKGGDGKRWERKRNTGSQMDRTARAAIYPESVWIALGRANGRPTCLGSEATADEEELRGDGDPSGKPASATFHLFLRKSQKKPLQTRYMYFRRLDARVIVARHA